MTFLFVDLASTETEKDWETVRRGGGVRKAGGVLKQSRVIHWSVYKIETINIALYIQLSKFATKKRERKKLYISTRCFYWCAEEEDWYINTGHCVLVTSLYSWTLWYPEFMPWLWWGPAFQKPTCGGALPPLHTLHHTWHPIPLLGFQQDISSHFFHSTTARCCNAWLDRGFNTKKIAIK